MRYSINLFTPGMSHGRTWKLIIRKYGAVINPLIQLSRTTPGWVKIINVSYRKKARLTVAYYQGQRDITKEAAAGRNCHFWVSESELAVVSQSGPIF